MIQIQSVCSNCHTFFIAGQEGDDVPAFKEGQTYDARPFIPADLPRHCPALGK